MKIAAFLLCSALLYAQAPADLPHTVVLTGAGYSPSTSPALTTSLCVDLLVSGSAGLYSYSCYNSAYYRGKPATSAETGADLVIRCYGSLCLHALGAGGVSTGLVTSGAFSVGAAASVRLKRGFTLAIPIELQRNGGTGATYRILAGWSW